MKILRVVALLGICTIVWTAGLGAAESKGTLYERLGGRPAIEAVASGVVDSILADKRVNKWFVHAASSPANTAAYKAKLADFLCQSTEGPCQYTGQDMTAAHRGRKVTAAAFDAVVEDLVAVLQKLKVPEKEKAEILALLGPLKSVIVQR